MPTFKWLFLKNLRSTTLRRKCCFQPHFFALDDTRTAIQSLLHAVVSSSAKHSHRLDFFQIAWTDSGSPPPPPDVPIEIQDHPRRHSSSSAILLSTPGSKRWMSMVMADDENSDFVANDAEQEVIREPPQIRSPDITLPD